MSPELARPAPDQTPEPAAERRQETANVVTKRGRVHRFPSVRTGVCATDSWSVPARLYGGYIQARWGRTGVCFESRSALAAQFNTSVRSIRRWEFEGVVAGLWRIEPRGRGRQLVLLKSGHGWPPSTSATVANHCTTVATGCPDSGQTCSASNEEQKTSSRPGSAAGNPGGTPLPAPVSDALRGVEAFGIRDRSLQGIRERFLATWRELDRRGGDSGSLFRTWWKKLADEARAPTVKNPAAWLFAALVKNDRADALLTTLLRPGADGRSKPPDLAYQEFVVPQSGA